LLAYMKNFATLGATSMSYIKTPRGLCRLSPIAFSSLLATLLPRSYAVVTYGTGNNFDFSAAPQSTVINYEGAFGAYTGTTIAPNYLLTATHTNPGTSATFAFGGGTAANTNYNVQEVASIDDVSVWTIAASSPAATFPTYAPLYSGSSEVGGSVIDIGRGVTRGAAVTGGWAWGNYLNNNNPFSWGTNTIASVDPAAAVGASQAYGDDYLQFNFSNNPANPNEAIDTVGDSGGGLFINNNGVYQLAGLNSLVGEAQDQNGNNLSLSLYDSYGYYQSDVYGDITQINTHAPLASYVSRLSSKTSFINSVTGVTTPVQDAAAPIVSNGAIRFFLSSTTGAILGNGTLQIGYASSYTTLTIAPNSGVSVVSSLSLDVNSSLDLTNNAILINYSYFGDPRATIVAELASGFNHGLWNGKGIRSSAAAATSNYGIGYADGADGLDPNLSSGQLEIAYTLYGDCTLAGSVSGTDLSIIGSHWGHSVTGGWAEGDFNGNGIVDANDFALFAHNFGKSDSSANLFIPTSEWAALQSFAAAHGLTSYLPEPATSSFALILTLATAARRRRAKSVQRP
jgi:hypothetical protein